MQRRGFTMIEMIIVILVGAILASITMASFGTVQNRTAVRQSRNAFAALHARARAQAIEFGTMTMFEMDVGGDSAWISRNDTILERVNFAQEFDVDVQSTKTRYTLCMSPRGYADGDCGSLAGPAAMTFSRGSDSMSATMLPLGQLQMPGNR
jgi:prepilin-type N-terminal cleavage/methylation domain-containing protein